MDVVTILDLAAEYKDCNESSQLCYQDARACWNDPIRSRFAARRAIDSLAHSVGIFHPAYRKAKELFDKLQKEGHES